VERRKLDVRHDVRGPAGEPGFLLVAPPSEALDWDVQHEVASTCRYWMASHQAWWIAAPYLSTAWDILERLDPQPEPAWLRFLRPHLSPQLNMKLLSLTSLGGSLRSTADRV
jgi:hypothetical protein